MNDFNQILELYLGKQFVDELNKDTTFPQQVRGERLDIVINCWAFGGTEIDPEKLPHLLAMVGCIFEHAKKNSGIIYDFDISSIFIAFDSVTSSISAINSTLIDLKSVNTSFDFSVAIHCGSVIKMNWGAPKVRMTQVFFGRDLEFTKSAAQLGLKRKIQRVASETALEKDYEFVNIELLSFLGIVGMGGENIFSVK